MQQGKDKRDSTRYRRLRRQILHSRPDCAICLQPMRFGGDHLHPLAAQVDHIVPVARGGQHTIDNMQPVCRACNRRKADRMPGDTTTTATATSRTTTTTCPPGPCTRCRGVHYPRPGVTFETSRRW